MVGEVSTEIESSAELSATHSRAAGIRKLCCQAQEWGRIAPSQSEISGKDLGI